MLPFKWKIFRIVNYAYVAGVAALIIILLYWAGGLRFSNRQDFLFFLLFITCALCLMTNGSLNVYLLEKCYPDKYPSRVFLITNTILLILSVLILLFLVFIAGWGIYEEVRRPRQYNRYIMQGRLLLLLVSTISLTGLYSCCFQLHLRRVIRRNHLAILNNFLES